MTQQKISSTPFTPEIGPPQLFNTAKAMVAPLSYGVELGFAWAQTVNPEVLKRAALYPTVDEHLDE